VIRELPVVVAAMGLAACPASSLPPEERPSPEAVAEGFVRECGSGVSGDPNLENASTFGPLTLVGIREAATLPPRAFRERRGRFQATKLLAVVRGTRDVTVTVPTSERAHVALLYDPHARANRHGFRFTVGDFQVTFGACPSREAQYNGGLIATRPGCVRLDIQPHGSAATTGWLSLGAGFTCPGSPGR
jgi:hypothetical protein